MNICLSQWTDEALLAAANDGNDEALGLLLFRERKMLAAAMDPQLGERLRSSVAVDDALQETYRRAFVAFATAEFGDGSKSLDAFRAWLRQIATNVVRQLGRSATAKKRGGEFARIRPGGDLHGAARDLLTEISTGDETASQFVARAEAYEALHVALAGLSDDQQQAIRLQYFDQLSVEAIAQRMQRTSGSIRGLLDRARAALRIAMHNSALWFSHRD